MKYRLVIAVLALGLCSALFAQEKSDYPRISFVGPGASKNPVSRDQFIILVIEGPFLSHEKDPIPDAGTVDYVNRLLKTKNVSYIGVYTRQGVKYGDVIHALDVLRKTTAKEIGVSMVEISAGQEP
jgi:hypothetical protein